MGMDHLLVKTWEEVIQGLKDGQACVTLTYIDFEQAFNHAVCLRALSDHGASRSSINLVCAFLTGRTMKVRIGSALSSGRPVCGGGWQGYILGNYLFCMSTDRLERGLGGKTGQEDKEHETREGK